MMSLQLVLGFVAGCSAAINAKDLLRHDLEVLAKEVNSLSNIAPSLEKERSCKNMNLGEKSFESCENDGECGQEDGEEGCWRKCMTQETFEPFNKTCEDPSQSGSAYCLVLKEIADGKKPLEGVCMWVVEEHLPDFVTNANALKTFHKTTKMIKAGAIKDDEGHSKLGQALGLPNKKGEFLAKKRAPPTASYEEKGQQCDSVSRTPANTIKSFVTGMNGKVPLARCKEECNARADCVAFNIDNLSFNSGNSEFNCLLYRKYNGLESASSTWNCYVKTGSDVNWKVELAASPAPHTLEEAEDEI